MENQDCDFDIMIAPDVPCTVYGKSYIEAILYTKVGHPLQVVVPANGNAIQLYSQELARRLALSNDSDEKIQQLDIKKGTMPFASPAFKTDPHRNIKAVSDQDTQMKIEWDEHRDNDVIHDFYEKTNDGRTYLCWGKSGNHLIGGSDGLVAGFTSTYAVLDDASFPHRKKAAIEWVGNPVPKRLRIA
jgi:hypothetical protein